MKKVLLGLFVTMLFCIYCSACKKDKKPEDHCLNIEGILYDQCVKLNMIEKKIDAQGEWLNEIDERLEKVLSELEKVSAKEPCEPKNDGWWK